MATLELEHCVGGIYTISNSLHYHNDGKTIVTVAGAAIVLSDITDPHNQSFLHGHSGTICSIALSPNGKYIASGQLGDDADVIVWDFERKKLIHKLCQHEHGVSTIAFSLDSRLLLTVGDFFDRKLFIWDIESGGIVANVQVTSTGSASIHQTAADKRPPPQPSRMTAATGSVRASSSSTMGEGEYVAAAWGGHARDIKRRETTDLIFATAGPIVSLWTLTPHTGELHQEKFQTGSTVRSFTSVGFTTDGERCIAGTTSGDFAVFLVRTMVMEMLVPACSGGIRTILVLPSNSILVGGGDGTLTKFSPSGRSYIATNQKRIGEPLPVASSAAPSLSHSYQMPSSSSSSSSATPSSSSSSSSSSSTAPCPPITALSNGGGETRVITASIDGTVHSTSLTDWSVVPLSYSHSGPVTSLSFPLAISDKFATCSPDDGTVRVWDLSTYDTLSLCQVAKEHPRCVSWCGDCLCVGYDSGEIRFVDGFSGDVLWTVVGAHKGMCSAICGTGASSSSSYGGGEGEAKATLGGGSELFVSGGETGEVRVWSVRDRSLKTQLKEHTQRVSGVTLFGDRSHFVSWSKDGRWSCVDLARERRVGSYRSRGSILGLALLPDEQRVITTCSDRCVVFWDMAVADPVRVIKDAHEDQVTCISVANDSDMFATGGMDNVVKLWDLKGSLIGEFHGHSASINAIGFTPDDKQLISVGDDGNCLIWNVY
ncbi:putative WD40 repeat protein [Monocercomonoides exilis]|uniref:putative WD40 repeat protein n=1 Tax=Monocercomonoides exilis TaxID=2049356 RepID=UPI003559766B|nr:putative WD40 repeat protein [Monocercomonoides exilis]|eukprot:MONOS_3090.1-p1 / transcript=MONOS_3090.1 / gene=MONOS_3090 / organism=Monocercomonoides_exilis_PA203 / gene_product=WD40 repeat protein / transcript_product=WD40 repeat protein / location=Mono_scaffold00069:79208-83612(-) / protein_length=711 / sequence_SO=supercontig / SO=protein_coding / is_pseudo=false